MGLVEQDEEGGRMITKELRSLMDQILHHQSERNEKNGGLCRNLDMTRAVLNIELCFGLKVNIPTIKSRGQTSWGMLQCLDDRNGGSRVDKPRNNDGSYS